MRLTKLLKPVHGYWDIRGYAHPTRLLLQYLQIDHEDKQYTHGPPPDFHRENWLQEKFTLGLEFPNLPYWIDNDIRMTESNAIFKHIARTRGPELVPTDPISLTVSEMVHSVANDILRSLVAVTYGKATDDLETSLEQKLQNLNDFLEKKQYILGNKIAYVDFFVYEALHQLQKFKRSILQQHPHLLSYLDRVESLPQLKDYIQSTASLPCWSESAIYHY